MVVVGGQDGAAPRVRSSAMTDVLLLPASDGYYQHGFPYTPIAVVGTFGLDSC